MQCEPSIPSSHLNLKLKNLKKEELVSFVMKNGQLTLIVLDQGGLNRCCEDSSEQKLQVRKEISFIVMVTNMSVQNSRNYYTVGCHMICLLFVITNLATFDLRKQVLKIKLTLTRKCLLGNSMIIKFKIFERKNMAFVDLLNDSNHLSTKFIVEPVFTSSNSLQGHLEIHKQNNEEL